MKKLFYGLSSSRSFAKLFSLLACVALWSLFAQQAVAQDFFFGWEPFPPQFMGRGMGCYADLQIGRGYYRTHSHAALRA